MNILIAIVAFLTALIAVLVGVTRIGSWQIERRNPPVGSFVSVAGARIHIVHDPAPANAELPPVVFIHGASANLKDQMLPLRPLLEGRAEMLFWDRPGHGWSSRGAKVVQTPFDQADLLASLMDAEKIPKAIVVSHSFGGAVAAAFALKYPDRIAGLVFISPATHPWPGGATSWYYDVAKLPILGRLFTETVSEPVGSRSMRAAMECVFAPNKAPDRYLEDASIELVLRPSAFRANARDVAGLYDHAVATAPRYTEIKAPTVVISGDRDTVVAEEIHSRGMARDIAGSELVWLHNVGHKPDWVAPELAVAAIGKLAGEPADLQALARTVDARVAGDAHGSQCDEAKLRIKELAPQ
jgi:pimeloyl-ACP methyl ester carboxylesterase